jgi:outer membrane beta-barrel protein
MFWHRQVSHHLQHLVLSAIFLIVGQNFVFAADAIEFPEEELAKESVLPVFDKKVAVRDRIVNTTGRFELGGGGGLNLIEALYNNITFNALASYNFDEMQAFTLQAIFPSTSLSNMGKDLQAGKGLNNKKFDASKAPAPEYLVSGLYQYTAYYGKISMTKESTMNLSLHGMAGGGMVSWGDSMEPMLNVGMGQKLYFTPNVALRFDLNLMMYQGPDPTSKDLDPSDPARESDYFKKTLYMRSFLTAGVVFLL